MSIRTGTISESSVLFSQIVIVVSPIVTPWQMVYSRAITDSMLTQVGMATSSLARRHNIIAPTAELTLQPYFGAGGQLDRNGVPTQHWG